MPPGTAQLAMSTDDGRTGRSARVLIHGGGLLSPSANDESRILHFLISNSLFLGEDVSRGESRL